MKTNKIIHKTNLDSLGILIFTIYMLTWHAYISILPYIKLEAVILSMTLISLTLSMIKNKNSIIKLTRIDFLWFLFIIFFFPSVFDLRLPQIFQLYVFITCIAFIVFVKTDIDNFSVSFKLIKIAGFLYAIGVLFQYFLPNLYFQYVYPIFNDRTQTEVRLLYRKNLYSGFTFQTAYTAGHIVNGLGLILFSLKMRTRKQNIVDIILLFLLFLALIFTGKRGHMLFSLISIIITCLSLSSGISKFKKLISIILILSIFMTGFIFVSEYIGLENKLVNSYKNIVFRTSNREDITSGRVLLYRNALELFKEHPIRGIGWGNFREQSLGILSTTRKSHVHNIYLQLLTETGIICFAVFLVALIYTYYKTYKLLVLMRDEKLNLSLNWRSGILFSFYSQTFFILYGITGNLLTDKMFLVMYFIAVSIVGSAIKEIKEKEDINY